MINARALVRTTNILVKFLGVTANHKNNTAIKIQLQLGIPSIYNSLSSKEKLSLEAQIRNHLQIENALLKLDFRKEIIRDIVQVFYHEIPATEAQRKSFRDNGIA